MAVTSRDSSPKRRYELSVTAHVFSLFVLTLMFFIKASDKCLRLGECCAAILVLLEALVPAPILATGGQSRRELQRSQQQKAYLSGWRTWLALGP